MRKIISMLLTLIIVFPNVVVAQTMDEKLEELVVLVKQKLEIPKELDDFNYYITENNNNMPTYRFEWESTKKQLGSVSVRCEGNGRILQYNYYDRNEKYNSLANISYEEGLQAANTFLQTVCKEDKANLVLDKDTELRDGNVYTYQFDEYQNGYKVFRREVVVNVSKYTGKVIYYSAPRSFEGKYEQPIKYLSNSEAERIYIDKIGVELSYVLDRDYDEKRITARPIYRVENREYKAIDAANGLVVIPYQEEEVFPVEYDTCDKAEGGIANLTAEEKAEIDKSKKFLTPTQIMNKDSKYFPMLANEKIQNARLVKDSFSKRYKWILQTDTNYLISDAVTGEIIQYRERGVDEKEVPANVDEKQIQQKVETFLEKIAPTELATCKLIKEEENIGKEKRYLNYYYNRMVNGIEVEGNGLFVTYDIANNKIIAYDKVWDEVTFPSIKEVVGKQKIATMIGIEPTYIEQVGNTQMLAYTHEESLMAFDPFTGKRINSYTGEVYEPNIRVVYTDISRHPLARVIQTLSDSGYFLPGDMFMPDAPITQVDFLRYFLRITDNNTTDKQVYKMAVEQGILTEEEIDEKASITYTTASYYLINASKYKEIAKLSSIYQYPFKKETLLDEKYKGSITLATGLGWIRPSNTTSFNPNQILTRAKAAQIIYYMLLNQHT